MCLTCCIGGGWSLYVGLVRVKFTCRRWRQYARPSKVNRTASVTDFVIVAVNSSTLKSLVSLDLVALLSGAD